MRILLVALAAASALLAECTRTPAEDFSSRAASNAPVSTATTPAAAAAASATSDPASAHDSSASRCVQPTPAHPPPPVAPGPAPGCPADPESNQKVPLVRVVFPEASADAGGAAVDAELVSTPHDTQRGLMYRRSMAESRGMLFDLHERDDHQFWMHNTCIPLDLVYVDVDGLIVGIVENAPTLDDTPRGVGCPSRYVLEVNAGWTRRHGVKAGQHTTIPPEAR